MKVTLAMGLQYEHTTKHSPPQREDFAAHLKPAEHIIDVKPITPKSTSTLSIPEPYKNFYYITYNKSAALVLIPQIGTQLNISI